MVTDDREGAQETESTAAEPEPRVPSDTVGTGSYVAVSCSVLMILATLLLVGGLLIARWLT